MSFNILLCIICNCTIIAIHLEYLKLFFTKCDIFAILNTNKLSGKKNNTNLVDKQEDFMTAIKENEGFIYKIASIYTKTIEDRNDLIQEIFYQLWKSFGTFNQKSSLSTWMYRVALNVAIYHLKIAGRKILTMPLDEHIFDIYEINDSEIEEKWHTFKQLIDSLNLLDKGIVILYLENKSHEEIAQIIGISASNVGTKLSRIKDRLKQKFHKI